MAMKTKDAIRKRISRLVEYKRKSRQQCKEHNISSEYLRNALAIVDSQIMAMKWVLGYKQNMKYYWCFNCQLMHRGAECPRCHSANVLNPKTRGE
jgi:hypothetical protein